MGNSQGADPKGWVRAAWVGCALDVDALRREAGPRLGGQAQASICHSDCKLSMQLLWCL